jgi:hypothetical protein
MSENREQISESIVSYLGKHPEAQDTLEGIAQWWLALERVESSTEAVADALQSLTRQGIVTLRVSRDGTTLYSLRKRN